MSKSKPTKRTSSVSIHVVGRRSRTSKKEVDKKRTPKSFTPLRITIIIKKK